MKIIKNILNVLISISLFSLVVLLMFISSSRTIISRENISRFISDADILNVDINVLFNQEESGITLKEKITILAQESNIPEEIIADILNSDEINQLLGDFFNQTIKYIIEGGNKPQISISSIEDIKEFALKSLDEHLNVMISEEELEKYIENYCDKIIEIIPERNIIVDNSHIDTIDKIINFNILYICTIIILILLLFCIINKKWFAFIKYLGIIMFVSGVMFVILGSLDYIIVNLITSKISTMIPFVIPLITNILTIWFKTGVFVSFTSVILILIYAIINKIYNKKL